MFELHPRHRREWTSSSKVLEGSDDFRLRKQNDRRSVDDHAFNHVEILFQILNAHLAPARCDAVKQNQKKAHAQAEHFRRLNLGGAGLLQTTQHRSHEHFAAKLRRSSPKTSSDSSGHFDCSLCLFMADYQKSNRRSKPRAPACHDDDETVFSVRLTFIIF